MAAVAAYIKAGRHVHFKVTPQGLLGCTQCISHDCYTHTLWVNSPPQARVTLYIASVQCRMDEEDEPPQADSNIVEEQTPTLPASQEQTPEPGVRLPGTPAENPSAS
eukprot:1180425-Prorocentrum_minimum.AAC.2